MPQAGDRVVVEGTKVGGGRREGTLLELTGRLMKVRWEDGAESIMAPGAGAVRFLPGTSQASRSSKAPAKASKPAAKAKGKKR